MKELSPYFKRKEFACKCGCGFDTVDSETLDVLMAIREHFMAPVSITSGCRCVEYNKKVKGKKGSFHLQARASDIQVKGVEPDEVYQYLCKTYPGKYGFGKYKTFTHLDTRSNGPARWGN